MGDTIVDLRLPLPCIDLLPHRAPLLLAGELLEREPGRARLRAVVGEDNPFVDAAGRLDGAAVIELAAQATAALKGYEARLRGEPVKIGYLVGIRDFELGPPARVGDELDLAVQVDFAMEQAALVYGEVRRGAEVIGAGTIKIWEEREWPTPPERINPQSSADSQARCALQSRPVPEGRLVQTNPGDLTGVTINNPHSACRMPHSLDPLGRALAGAMLACEDGGENRVAGEFFFGDDFPGFQGHFPGFSILPAVLMPRMALLLVEAKAGRRMALRRVEQAKIAQGVFPGDRVKVEAMLEPQEGADGRAMRLKAKLAGPRGQAASFTLGCEMDAG